MKTTGLVKMVSVFGILMMLAVGCTQERQAEFPDGQGSDIFSKSELVNSSITIKTDGEFQKLSARDTLRSFGEKPYLKIIEVNAPDSIKAMFKDLKIHGKTGAVYSVAFELNVEFLTAFKILQDESELIEQERHLILQDPSLKSQNKIKIPLFQYAIKNYGKVVRTKNDLNEETATLRMDPIEWDQATHIQISTLSKDRLEIVAPTQEEAERIFMSDRLNGSVFNQEQLKAELDISVAGPEQALYLSSLNGQSLNLFELKQKTNLTEAEKKLLKSGNGTVISCSETVKSQLPVTLREQCIAVLKFNIKVRKVVARRKTDVDGVLMPELEFVEVGAGTKTTLVRIEKNPVVQDHNVADEVQFVDPTKMLVLEELKGKEFLFRRTLQDSPSSFAFSFPGVSGPLEIVKFDFTKDRVRVLRADASRATKGSNDRDKQVLLSMPAVYYKKEMTAADGTPLSLPRWVRAEQSDEKAIALVDWTENEIPNVSSPLDYYGVEQCFSKRPEIQVSEVEQKLSEEGLLNFSLSSTYAASTFMDCAGISLAGYFDEIQTTFTFKERISFKAYHPKDETPLLDVPYLQQKLLGFGVFTYKKEMPNEFGNGGFDGTEIPLPALFDLKNGKKIKYILSGLPENDNELRSALISATQDVIANWNVAFKKAFKGTSLERADDVLELKIDQEGEDQLGDLDKNFIYLVQKQTSQGIIGLGGSHSNPRSGKVEAASTFVYTGNISSYVDFIMRRNAIKKKANSLRLSGESTETQAIDAMISEITAGDSVSTSNLPGNSIEETRALSDLKVREDIKNDIPSIQAELKNYAKILSQIAQPNPSQQAEKILNNFGASQSALALYEAYRKTINEGKLTDPGSLEVEINKALLKSLSGKLTKEEFRRFKAQSERQQVVSKIVNNLKQSHICVFDTSEAPIPTVEKDETPMDVYIGVYKSTLAHELGHNLGLRHNFIASFDKANWKFDENEKTIRRYSSVMDYQTDDHEYYDGLGPQDVMSIRAAYAHLMELDPRVVAQLPEKNGKKVIPISETEVIALVDNKFISIADYKKALGVKSWINLTSQDVKKLPLKVYQFCSDEDVLYQPTCNVFDRGTTPAEVVQAKIEDYKDFYEWRNFPNDRLRFGWYDVGSYIGRLFQDMIPVRMFLEETLYQAISGASPEVINANVQAAVDGLLFFHEIIRTPDAPVIAQGDERFVEVDLSNGKKEKIERKWIQNIGTDERSDRINARGIEFDKVIALIMLTERSWGFPRYERVSLRVAYPELEALLVSSENPLDRPTLGLLTELLAGQVTPLARTSEGLMPLNDARFKVTTTEMMRVYAALGSIVNLEVNGIEAKDNNASFFRVMSGFKAPAGVELIMKPGSSLNDRSERRFWSYQDAVSTHNVVHQGVILASLATKKPQLQTLLNQWLELKLKDTQEDTQKIEASAETDPEAPVNDIEKIEKELDQVLADAPEEAGPKTMKEIGPLVLQIIQIAQDLDATKAQLPSYAHHQVDLAIDSFETQIENISKGQPTMGTVLSVIPATLLKSDTLTKLVPSMTLRLQEATIFGNLELLNRFYYTLHGIVPTSPTE